jgi:cyclophilin family peptidyl-prolyl cis-trans isomerase
MKTSHLIIILIVLVLILVGLHSWQVSRPVDNTANSIEAGEAPEFNPYSFNLPTGHPPGTSATGTDTTSTSNSSTKNLMHTITIETNKGNIVFQTYDGDAPKTVENFVSLANKGFYNGVIFHRVISGFMIQGGDPTGTGRGGPGYQFADELNPNTESYKKGYVRGTLAMANAGPNTNGSQFFIMHKDYPLPNNYTIFGKVISGMDVVDAIAESETDPSDKPLQNMTMNKVTVKKN